MLKKACPELFAEGSAMSFGGWLACGVHRFGKRSRKIRMGFSQLPSFFEIQPGLFEFDFWVDHFLEDVQQEKEGRDTSLFLCVH